MYWGFIYKGKKCKKKNVSLKPLKCTTCGSKSAAKQVLSSLFDPTLDITVEPLITALDLQVINALHVSLSRA